MRTREEQINSLWNSLTTEHWSSPEDEKLAREHILEAERRGYEKREEDYNECVKILGGPAESLGPQPPELPEQQDTAQQIEGVCNLLIELGQDSGCYATAERIVLEAERRAEARVRAEIARDSSKHYPVHYAPVEGQAFPEMQENIRSHPLYLMGDARLVWVSEGDLYMPGAAVLVEKDKPSTDAAREVV